MKQLILLMLACFAMSYIKAQGLPAHTCGIVYTYDAAGNRIKQEYVCNNTNTAFEKKNSNTTSLNQIMMPADKLYPNPTTGSFRIQFAKQLDNAQVVIISMAGQIMQTRTISGQVVEFNIGNFPSGIYLVRVREKDGSTTSFKVVRI